MKSDTIAEIAKALALAQAEMRGAVKDSENPHLKSKYADLASVWDACREPLTKNGLSVVQSTRMEGGAVVVVTMLLHSSGEYISGEISLSPVKTDPQGHGSAITYARRYALAAMVGVSPEDDDGNAGSGRGKGGHEAEHKKNAQPSAPIETPHARASRFLDGYKKRLDGLTDMGAYDKLVTANMAAREQILADAPAVFNEIAAAEKQTYDRINQMSPFK